MPKITFERTPDAAIMKYKYEDEPLFSYDFSPRITEHAAHRAMELVVMNERRKRWRKVERKRLRERLNE
ncbi:hypothetical protein J8TS2_24140 [Lederbergia ruris]|uniref:Uncharacterized protein n=1 Tax=Lederbergia ruris TaxID=217495 RepID=A0ABQ4KJF8_9BACI|nr:hypothetical protein [Lederbergia ruris]GIN58095.1 hypothetical protein J8TS2_24140 [Lederbergia ruris]